MNITVTHIDTACILLEIDGYRIMTDPTLDNAGQFYYHGYGAASRKTENPAYPITGINNIDLILLSHHQHKDNFDNNGKSFTKNVANVISTKNASKALSGVIGLDNWQTQKIETDKIKNLRITATPAQHHPGWIPEFISGKVIGFIIEFDGQENGVIYISGDTVYFKGIDEVAKRYKIDVGIFHVGSVQFRYLTGFGQYTMDSKDLIKAVNVLNPNKVIPIHHKGWTHFKEKEARLRESLLTNVSTRDRTIFLKSGEPAGI
ncbi:L-ascorbate metabolism protein UlaG, beta-lactamase superfamily [Chitinophaga sp. CF118]|uniref:MBL fold metallo-hydrolase n=1 Tax=Chitinophaga sp. CF118 TaxID=1884367 RepID=UPI0008E4CFB6|nr:MBL fold metallo-hydrolase [Chitinophaga sp. CF118]SFD22144.1 L-ascorbate metabolism protein UlaG, beta-lactamase superfamily [Chitinophaga sp. CF118]